MLKCLQLLSCRNKNLSRKTGLLILSHGIFLFSNGFFKFGAFEGDKFSAVQTSWLLKKKKKKEKQER